MTYWTLNAIFLAPVAIVAVLTVVRSRRRAHAGASTSAVSWQAVLISAAILLSLTAVFDNLMIRIGLVAYNPDWISGVFVGVAPLEDFAYTVAAVVLLPALWSLFTPLDERTHR
ncbi:lycopene cyclase domain-containing protein [Arthrobacter sp. H20]|uniref:lycopene cyclase domain-containing protein n=1 Tax=Arthrobacter sp. H20 TaxID=1267981 RepID=UPI0004AF6568|nr:lycopene cyclase domain-containing protein [Arthrobacter sp. H20]